MSSDGNKSKNIAPFTMFSSSATGGYLTELHDKFTPGVEINNLHTDMYGEFRHPPAQGPFTNKFVGGSPHRNAEIGSTSERQEAFYISFLAPQSFLFESTDTEITPIAGSPTGTDLIFELDGGGNIQPLDPPASEDENWIIDAEGNITTNHAISGTGLTITRPLRPILYRDEFAKRPVNIRNIKQQSPGNFANTREILHTAGRTSNPGQTRAAAYSVAYPLFPRNENPVLNTPITDEFPGGLEDYAMPELSSSASAHVFVNRFSSPGDRYTMSRGFLNPIGEEYSAYNTMPFRNLNVRAENNANLTTHNEQFAAENHSTNRNPAYKKLKDRYDAAETSELLISNLTGAYGITVDKNNKKMYYCNRSTGLGVYGDIYRANLDGTEEVAIITSTINDPRGISLDTVNEKIYFADYAGGAIYSASLDGSGLGTIQSGLDSPNDVVLDIEEGHIYYVDRGNVDVFRCNLDGTSKTDVTPAGLSDPVGLTIDTIRDKMYVADRGGGIYKADLDGSNSSAIIGADTPMDVFVDEKAEKLYIADIGDNGLITRCNLDGTSGEDVVTFSDYNASYPHQLFIDTDSREPLSAFFTDTLSGKIVRVYLDLVANYDNANVAHAIPQNTLQYSWISAAAESSIDEFQGFATGSDLVFYSDVIDLQSDFETIRETMNKVYIDETNNTQDFDFVGSVYGYNTWKQIRGGELKLSRHYRENSILAATNNKDIVTQFSEPAVVAKHKPLEHVIGIDETNEDYTVKSSYGNDLVRHSNEEVNKLFAFIRSDASTTYTQLKDNYINRSIDDPANPVKRFVSMTYGETVFPRSSNTFTGKIRLRGNYTEIAGTGNNGYDRLYGTQNTIYSSTAKRTSTALNSQGLQDISLAFDPMKSDGMNSFQESASFSYNVGELNLDTDVTPSCTSWIGQEAMTELLESITNQNNLVAKRYYDALASQKAADQAQYEYDTCIATSGSGHPDCDDEWDDYQTLSSSASSSLALYQEELEELNQLQLYYDEQYSAQFELADPCPVTASLNFFESNSIIVSSSAAGLVSTDYNERLVEEMSGKQRWYDSYAKYAENIKGMVPEGSIIPEFRVSEHMNNYIELGSENFRRSNKNFLTLLGGEYSASAPDSNSVNFDSDFEETYMTTDTVENYDKIKKDHIGHSKPKRVTIKATGVKKLLPYNGFYPDTRTVQLGTLLKDSVYRETGSEGANDLATLLKPLVSPGILYNTIKSGLAMDYPIFTGKGDGQATVNATRTFISGGIPNDYIITDSAPDTRLPFETLVDLNGNLPVKKDIIGIHRTPIYSSLTSSTNYVYDRYYRWDGKKKPQFEMATHNFLASTVDFFLKNSQVNTFSSAPQNEFKQVKADKKYYLDVVLRDEADMNRFTEFSTEKEVFPLFQSILDQRANAETPLSEQDNITIPESSATGWQSDSFSTTVPDFQIPSPRAVAVCKGGENFRYVLVGQPDYVNSNGQSVGAITLYTETTGTVSNQPVWRLTGSTNSDSFYKSSRLGESVAMASGSDGIYIIAGEPAYERDVNPTPDWFQLSVEIPIDMGIPLNQQLRDKFVDGDVANGGKSRFFTMLFPSASSATIVNALDRATNGNESITLKSSGGSNTYHFFATDNPSPGADEYYIGTTGSATASTAAQALVDVINTSASVDFTASLYPSTLPDGSRRVVIFEKEGFYNGANNYNSAATTTAAGNATVTWGVDIDTYLDDEIYAFNLARPFGGSGQFQAAFSCLQVPQSNWQNKLFDQAYISASIAYAATYSGGWDWTTELNGTDPTSLGFSYNTSINNEDVPFVWGKFSEHQGTEKQYGAVRLFKHTSGSSSPTSLSVDSNGVFPTPGTPLFAVEGPKTFGASINIKPNYGQNFGSSVDVTVSERTPETSEFAGPLFSSLSETYLTSSVMTGTGYLITGSSQEELPNRSSIFCWFSGSSTGSPYNAGTPEGYAFSTSPTNPYQHGRRRHKAVRTYFSSSSPYTVPARDYIELFVADPNITSTTGGSFHHLRKQLSSSVGDTGNFTQISAIESNIDQEIIAKDLFLVAKEVDAASKKYTYLVHGFNKNTTVESGQSYIAVGESYPDSYGNINTSYYNGGATIVNTRTQNPYSEDPHFANALDACPVSSSSGYEHFYISAGHPRAMVSGETLGEASVYKMTFGQDHAGNSETVNVEKIWRGKSAEATTAAPDFAERVSIFCKTGSTDNDEIYCAANHRLFRNGVLDRYRNRTEPYPRETDISVPDGKVDYLYRGPAVVDFKMHGSLFGQAIDSHGFDPAYCAYTPPGFYGDSVATLVYSSSLDEKPTIEEILSNVEIDDVLNVNPTKMRLLGGDYEELTAVQEQAKSTVGSSVQLLGIKKTPSVSFSLNADGTVSKPTSAENTANNDVSWVISTKFECPVVDNSSSLYSQNYSSHVSGVEDILDSIGSAGSASFAYPRSVWTSHGESTSADKGYFFELRESTKKTADDGSLIDLCGFTAGTKKVGTVADQKTIGEAIMVIPYVDLPISKNKTIEIETGKHFIRANKAEITRQKTSLEDNGYAVSEDIDTTSISQMIEGMKKYVIPPQYNFLKYKDIKPFACYFLEFEHSLSQRDLIDIWQGITPSIAVNPETEEVEISHDLDKHNFLHSTGVPTDIKFMIFKVKQRAAWNYYDITTDSTDDNRFRFDFQGDGKVEVVPEYNYNWPYDFFSLVERAKVDVDITFKKDDEE